MSGPRSIDRPSDPLDLFAVLSQEAPDLGTPEDLAEVRRAVTAMRRGQRLASGRAGRASWLPALDYRRAAAVGILSLGLLSLAAGGWRETVAPEAATVAPADGGLDAGGRVAAARAEDLGAEDWASGAARFGLRGDRWLSGALPAAEGVSLVKRPVFQDLMPSTASVYEIKGEGLDLVMVVDETLDV